MHDQHDQRSFEEILDNASHDLTKLAEGVLDAEVVVDLIKSDGANTSKGQIVAKVVRIVDILSIIVIASNFTPIPIRRGRSIPHAALQSESYHPPHEDWWKLELWNALRWALRNCRDVTDGNPRTERTLSKSHSPQFGKFRPRPRLFTPMSANTGSTEPDLQHALHHELPANVLTVEIKKESTPPRYPTMDAVAFKAAHFVEKSGWEKKLLLMHQNSRGILFFLREVVAGAKKFTIVECSPDHPFAPVLDEHLRVQVDYREVIDAEKLGPTGDLYNIREARKEGAKLLASFLPEVGIKQKTHKEDVDTNS